MARRTLSILRRALCIAVAACPLMAMAQDDPSRVWVLPLEIDFDSGAANGDAIISRLIPVNSLMVRKDWKLINIAMLTIADAPGGRPGEPGNPSPEPGPNEFGIGDLTDAVIYTPNPTGKFAWGVGLAVGIPIATDSVLGSGKWLAGPAIRLGYRPGKWQFGLLAANRWSYAGDSDRADVNQLLMRAVIRRPLANDWFFVSDPIITANWKGASGQKWLVPLGGGIGRSLEVGESSLNLSLQGYANVIKPDGAPDWVIRIGATFPFQLPDRN